MFSAYSVTARNSSFNTRNSILDSTEHSVGSDSVVNAISTEQRFYDNALYKSAFYLLAKQLQWSRHHLACSRSESEMQM